MKIVNGYDLLEYAKQRKLLLPAFNTTNLEMTKAIIKGLNDVHLPVWYRFLLIICIYPIRK